MYNIDYDDNLQLFIKRFKLIKSKGFIKSHRTHDTGIGKTLEDLMGVEENNLQSPDFGDIEIKSQRAFTGSKITLFTKSPSFPKGANRILRDTFGTPDNHYPELLGLHTSMYSSKFNNYKSLWGFRIIPDDDNKKVYLNVKNLITDLIVDINVYWDYEELNDKIEHKLKKVCFITADREKRFDGEYFHFKKCILMIGFSLEKLIQLIREDLIQFDIRIGAYKTGKNKGFFTIISTF